MKLGVPKETKVKEHRVSCTPGGARTLVQQGHTVLVETGAGFGSGFSDESYRQAGATVVPSAQDAWAAEMVLKVKEPQADEYQFLRPDLVLFTYLHLAAEPELTRNLLASRTCAIAYETVQEGPRRPLLEPMSEIAGRMSAIVGSYYLSKTHGGSGILLGGVPGVLPGQVLVLGGGTSGLNAARMAIGLGASVTILDIDLERLRFVDLALDRRVRTLYSNQQNLTDCLPSTDLLIGAVLVPGGAAPKLIHRAMLNLLQTGSVFVDISIDQGGCAETSRPTTHDAPVFVEQRVVHYCVTNMPGAYARTATLALTNATVPYALHLANLGIARALETAPGLRAGLNTYDGKVVYPAVGQALGLPFAANPFSEL